MEDLFEYQPESELNNSSQPTLEDSLHKSFNCREEEENQPEPQEENQSNDLSDDAIEEQLIPSTLENARQQEAPTARQLRNQLLIKPPERYGFHHY